MERREGANEIRGEEHNGPESKGRMQGRGQMWRYLKEFAAR